MDKIQPALTAEEWVMELSIRDPEGNLLRLVNFTSFDVHSDAGSWGMEGRCPRCNDNVRLAEHAWWDPVCDCGIWWDADGTARTTTDPHAVAALALKGQPFGFTRDRLALQKELHRALVDFDTGWIYNFGQEAIGALGQDIARIEALLPPEEDVIDEKDQDSEGGDQEAQG